MGSSNGRKWLTCHYCGNRYQRSNWMRLGPRRGGAVKDLAGRLITDTHERACARAYGRIRE